MDKKTISTNRAPRAVGPYAQAVVSQNMLFSSGQLGIDVASGKLAQGIEAQTHASMKNVGRVYRGKRGCSKSKKMRACRRRLALIFCTMFV